jgi:hypothetical protein
MEISISVKRGRMTSRPSFLESGFLVASAAGGASGEARVLAVNAGSLAPLEKTRGFGMTPSGNGLDENCSVPENGETTKSFTTGGTGGRHLQIVDS